MVVGMRQAFTLIELIFAIVIIAISVVSLPMMTQATSSGVFSNLETQEAILKAIVLTKSTIGENSFDDIDNVDQSTKTPISDDIGLKDYKFHHKYTLEVSTNDINSTFNNEKSPDIKKITTKIFNEDGDKLIASMSAYKFNY